MDKVEGPQEFTNYLENNIYAPTGEVLLSYIDPTTISMKGYDKVGEVYEQALNYTSVVAGITDTDDDSSDSIIGFGIIVEFPLFIINKFWQWITKALHIAPFGKGYGLEWRCLRRALTSHAVSISVTERPARQGKCAG